MKGGDIGGNWGPEKGKKEWGVDLAIPEADNDISGGGLAKKKTISQSKVEKRGRTKGDGL